MVVNGVRSVFLEFVKINKKSKFVEDVTRSSWRAPRKIVNVNFDAAIDTKKGRIGLLYIAQL